MTAALVPTLAAQATPPLASSRQRSKYPDPRSSAALIRLIAADGKVKLTVDLADVDGANLNNPDYNIGNFFTDRRIEVPYTAVSVKFRKKGSAGDRVNLSRYRGKRIALKRKAIMMILGCSDDAFEQLVRLKLVRRRTIASDGVGAFYSFDPAWTLRDLHDAWVEKRLGTPSSHADLRVWRDVREICRIGADEDVPPQVWAAAIRMLTELGTGELAEINGFLPLGAKATQRCQDVRRALSDHWRARTGVDVAHIDADMVREEFPELGLATGTNLHTTLGHEKVAPAPTLLGRAWRLGPLRRAAILLLFIAAAKEARTEDQANLVRAFELVDEVFTVIAPDGSALDQETVDLVVGTLAFGHLDDKVRPRVRDEAVRTFVVAVAWLNRWVKHTGGPAFAAFDCRQVGERRRVIANLTEVYGHLRVERRAERRDRAIRAAQGLVMLQETAFLRKEGLCDTDGLARRAILDMGDAPCVKFSAYDRVLAPDGRLLPGAQRNDWIVWRRPTPGEDLPDRPENPAIYVPPVKEVADPAAPDAEDDSDRSAAAVDLDDYIFEYLGCEAAIGLDAFDPWYITCGEYGTWVAPAMLDPEIQEGRHRLLIDWKLPIYPSTPEGLLRFGTSDSGLWRRMSAKRRTIFPLGQFTLAMRIAHLALRAIVESYCRSGEFRQMMHSLSRWPTEGDDGKPDFRFLAFRKVTDGDGRPTELDEFRVSAQTHDEAFELAEAIIDACHADEGQLPDIRPPVRLAWKCAPGPLIFSWRGKALGLAPLLVFLRYLLANTGEVLGFHDLRFANTKHGRLIGLTMIALQDALKHSHAGMTQYYASLTPEALAERSDHDLARRRAEQAARSTYRMAA